MSREPQPQNDSPLLLPADPGRLFESDRNRLEPAIQRVLESGWYVLGKECEAFEAAFASFVGVAGSVGVSSGTDALELALRSARVEGGDEVILPALTSSASATAVVRAGAVPVIVDVDSETLTIDPDSARSAVSSRTRAIMPVHLYGHPCEMDELADLADEHEIVLVEDCAQAHGAAWQGRMVGSFGQVSAFSFYPTKNLPALGDGGALVSDDRSILERATLLRQYGWRERQVSAEVGMNSRLDELQAAVLSERLTTLKARNERRRDIATRYDAALSCYDMCLPTEQSSARSVYHQYVIRLADRDGLQTHLLENRIVASVLYPVPLHLQDAFRDYPRVDRLDRSEQAARELLCLPIFPELLDEEVEGVILAIGRFVRSGS